MMQFRPIAIEPPLVTRITQRDEIQDEASIRMGRPKYWIPKRIFLYEYRMQESSHRSLLLRDRSLNALF